MTRKVFPASPGSASSSSSRSGNVTPSESSMNTPIVFNFQAGSDGQNTSGNYLIAPDALGRNQRRTSSCEPIASIERRPTPAFTFTASWRSSTAEDTPRSSVSPQSRTPSISAPPPALASSTTMGSTSTFAPDMRGGSLARDMRDLDISSRASSGEPGGNFHLREVEAALDGVAAQTNGPGDAAREGSGHGLVTPPRGHARRRSTPRPGPVVHKVEDEEPPSDEFHRPGFQGRLADARELLGDLAEVMSSSSVHLEPDSAMRGLHGRAGRLGRFEPQAKWVVGFVGDSGVGKSSLLNSLLDYRALARATDNGTACTCVMTEYHYHSGDDFAVEVERFSVEDLQKQVAELLGCYRNFHLNGQSLGEEVDEEARKDLEARATLADHTFGAMFRGKLQDKDWLVQESEEAILECFRAWITSASGGRSSSGRQHVSSQEECSKLLMQLTSEVPGAETTANWPYIRKVTVFLKAHILSKGLVLVDLPGLSDLNSARRNITERNIRNCDEIFAVVGISRAITDIGIKRVFELARDARLQHVGIVCTRSDEINPEQNKDDWGKEASRKIRRLMGSLRDLKIELEHVNEELATFHNLPSVELLNPETHQELVGLVRLKSAVEMQQNAKDYELRSYIMEMRNANAVRKLRDTYHSHTTEGTLPVFCVSNTMYWEKRMADISISRPLLHLSGIIGIRKHCIAMVAASQLRTLKNFLENDIPALLSDVELWVQSGSGSTTAEQKEATRLVLDKVEGQLRKEYMERSADIKMDPRFHQSLLGMEFTSYATFCRHNGNHSTKKIGPRNWNKEAMDVMVADLEGPWDSLRTSAQNQQHEWAQLIETTWDEATAILESEWPDSESSETEICQAIRSRKYLLVTAVEDIFDTLDRDLLTLEIDALTGVDTSMFGTVMSEVYREASSHYGGGSERRQKDTVTKVLTDKTIFQDLMRDFKESLELLAENVQQVMVETLATHLDDVQRTLDLVREQNVAEESERDPDFRSRVASEVVRVRDLLGLH